MFLPPSPLGCVNRGGLAAAGMPIGLPWALRHPRDRVAPAGARTGACRGADVALDGACAELVTGDQLAYALTNVKGPLYPWNDIAVLFLALASSALFLAVAWTAVDARPRGRWRPGVTITGALATLAVSLFPLYHAHPTSTLHAMVLVLTYLLALRCGVARGGAASRAGSKWLGPLGPAKALFAAIRQEPAAAAVRFPTYGGYVPVGQSPPDGSLLMEFLAGVLLYVGGVLTVRAVRPRRGRATP